MKKGAFALLFLIPSLSLPADPGLIKLANGVIDPSRPEIAGAGTLEASPAKEGRYLFIAQPEKNFTSAELGEIKELGLVKVGTVPPNAYIFLASSAQIKELGENFPLLFVGEYKPEYKVPLSVRKKTNSAAEPEKALIGLAAADCYDAVAEFLKGQNVAEFKLLYNDPPVVEAVIPPSLFSKLALKSEILSVWPKPVKKIMNEVARTVGLMNVEKANESGYTGKGTMVIVSDTGLDSGDLENIHDDFKDKTVIGAIGELNTERTDWSDIQGHGTHVAGSAVGTGAHYHGDYAGMAPEADLYFICLGDSSSYLEDITDGDIERAYAAGGRVMNNSWGSSSWNYGGEYNAEAQRYDTISRQYPDLLLIFAAGNENCKIDLEDNFSLSYEGVTKNCLTVGASENYRPELSYYYYGMLFDDIDIDDPYFYDQPAEPNNKTQQGMACFSSRGPAKDGRAKPDIVAPGTWIYSTESLYDDSNDGERKSYYTYKFGTSMASPLTAGACADIVQFLKEAKKFSSPSSALVKAVLINGARSMGNGQFDNAVEIPGETPNHVNGFGHVNLYESLNPSCGELFVTEGVIEETGKSVSYSFTKESDGPVSATLCWTDVPGTVGAALALVNDLDISVSDGENEYFASGKETPSDHLNNCERCQINDFPAGSRIEVKVSGYNLMEGPQAFALCVSGVNDAVPEPALAFAAFLFALLIFKKTK